jgi:hypothetical protein
MLNRKIELLMILMIVNIGVFAQGHTQTVRGRAIDKDSKQAMIGANVVILETDPILGSSTDIDGYFVIENVPVGRINIQVSALGYETQVLSNIVVETGKETVLNIESIEAYETLQDVTVKANGNKTESINKMATVSAKTVTVEETGRYAGALSDPARMVSAFAGVSSDPSGNNDIIVRGNSPRGILWKLEGVEIPNPNHFAGEGTTGGPVNTLNASMLANSDFFSGAFAPEYGNALSGVFDVKFRTGNNQKREHSFSLGILGTDITLEGPFSKKYKGSYLINYRYSTLDLLDKAGLVSFGGIPRYQDLSFKVSLPTESLGRFTIFGLGGKSSINQKELDEETEEVIDGVLARSSLAVMGVRHNYILNKKTYIQSFISASGTNSGADGSKIDRTTNAFFDYFNNDFYENKYRISTSINTKLNSKNNINTGIVYTYMTYNMFAKDNVNNTSPITRIDTKGSTSMMQLYSTWKHRLHKDVTMIAGVHYTQLFLNNNNALEPRLGIKWQMNQRQYLSLGAGMHSKIENISVYMSAADQNESLYHNKTLGLTKANHYVLGFGHQFNENLFFKTEVYYQHLYDVPVENDINSSFSMLNASGVYSNPDLVNEGSGRNYGLELTFERFFSNNYYYMITSSLYESKYTAKDGVERDSRFNANYSGNIVFGKEFILPSKKNNRTLAVNAKVSLLGGNRYTPIDLNASILEGRTVYRQDEAYTMKRDDIFNLNLAVTYRVNRKKTTHEFKLDIQNLTNNKAIVGQYYNSNTQKIVDYYQLSFIPNIMYIIKF